MFAAPMRLPIPLRRFLALALLPPVLAFSAPAAHAQLEQLCQKDVQRRAELLRLKRITTPERVADVYVKTFASKGAERDAQAIWRRVANGGRTVEESIDYHFARYYADRSESELALLRENVMGQMTALNTIRELVITFESAELTPQFAADAMLEAWSKRARWDAPQPPEHYHELILTTARDYVESGVPQDEAAVRAATQVRSIRDRDRGVSAGALHFDGDACFEGDVGKMEMALRHDAVGAPTQEEIAAGAEGARLTWYTHYSFGPRDYSFDRLAAWSLAAEQSR